MQAILFLAVIVGFPLWPTISTAAVVGLANTNAKRQEIHSSVLSVSDGPEGETLPPNAQTTLVIVTQIWTPPLVTTTLTVDPPPPVTPTSTEKTSTLPSPVPPPPPPSAPISSSRTQPSDSNVQSPPTSSHVAPLPPHAFIPSSASDTALSTGMVSRLESERKEGQSKLTPSPDSSPVPAPLASTPSSPPETPEPPKINDTSICNGLSKVERDPVTSEYVTNHYYIDYDFAVSHIRSFCDDLPNKPIDLNANWIHLEHVSPLGRNEFKFGVYFPAIEEAKPSPESCIIYFQNLLLDGCDGNDPNNPLNYKGGGTISRADPDGHRRYGIYYTIQPLGYHKRVLKRRRGQCYRWEGTNGLKIHMRGAGWAGEDGLKDLKAAINEACDHAVTTWQARDWATVREYHGPFEWSLEVWMRRGNEECFNGVIKEKFGEELVCKTISSLEAMDAGTVWEEDID
ncbi:hypothetical protein ABW19_dt0208935 [Dactylella cylindrospora]|nr:hypothetical protein ABW19_dt0208935 [Dactylella cylindrospora]